MRNTTITDLIANNRAWARDRTAEDSSFFHELAVNQQHPPYLWLGCSDSRVPASHVVGLEPGELFVHRNVANLAPPHCASYLSVMEFAVQTLKVRHILVVGHYGCGGVRAAMEKRRSRLIDHWLTPVRDLLQAHAGELEALADDQARHDRLCELNVLHQVQSVAANPYVLEAWEQGQSLTIHGWCYSLETGLLTDLHSDVSHA